MIVDTIDISYSIDNQVDFENNDSSSSSEESDVDSIQEDEGPKKKGVEKISKYCFLN